VIREEAQRAYTEVPLILCRNITGHCKDEDAYRAEVERVTEHL